MELTRRQTETLDAIQLFIDRHGYAPSTRELGAELGISSTSTIHGLLMQLKKKGRISWEPAQSRTLRVVQHAG
ncbi:hypothetical protein YDYSY3_60740 [Paenibacillus chitinolyticus]|uniref:LexA family protein n=1 Tax=Paenibacillus chitinolyticus TaxID=79263 RepID=UPI0026E4C97C|nr:heme-binding protein [Paenibacillus chitinolyticus]GKS15074.1 hypothetical protein YDYSY3_60740 [Paenibacillus chitinolyticus]